MHCKPIGDEYSAGQDLHCDCLQSTGRHRHAPTDIGSGAWPDRHPTCDTGSSILDSQPSFHTNSWTENSQAATHEDIMRYGRRYGYSACHREPICPYWQAVGDIQPPSSNCPSPGTDIHTLIRHSSSPDHTHSSIGNRYSWGPHIDSAVRHCDATCFHIDSRGEDGHSVGNLQAAGVDGQASDGRHE